MYAQRLRSAGVDVEHRDYEGMIHGFFTMAPMVDGAVQAQAQVCGALRSAFAQVAHERGLVIRNDHGCMAGREGANGADHRYKLEDHRICSKRTSWDTVRDAR